MTAQINVNQGSQPTPGMNTQPMMRQPRSGMPWVIIAIVLVIVLAVLAFLFRDKLSGTGNNANLSGYQAVFLTNGQVYFGKLSDVNSTYVTLQDIYYLQVNQQLQPGAEGDAAAAQQQQQEPQISLVKLGNELHGPDDVMKINRQQVLFFEDLKSDGRVAQAIADYQANGATQQTPTSNTGAQQQTPTQQQQQQQTPVPPANQ